MKLPIQATPVLRRFERTKVLSKIAGINPSYTDFEDDFDVDFDDDFDADFDDDFDADFDDDFDAGF